MQEHLRTTWLAADFFIHHYRISGRVNVRSRKLADQLNDQTTSFLRLRDAYVSNIQRPADIITNHPAAILCKDNIVVVAVLHREDGMPREHAYGSYFDTYLRKVFIIIPSFEIEGYLRLAGKQDPRAVLTSGTDRFIPIFDARMRSSLRPDVTFTGGAILVNKNYIGAFCMLEASDG